jgi:peptide/nickel transport system permease protein
LASFLTGRLAVLVPVLLIVATVGFLLLQLTPGDPAAVMAGPDATEYDIAMLRERLGLDRPLHIQLLRWFANLARGDLGRSIFFNQPVTTMILQRVEPTALLTSMSLAIAVGLGIPLGVIAAVNRGSPVDQAVMVVALMGLCVPAFWLLLNLIMVFSVMWRIFPVAGYVFVRDSLLQAIRHLILPAATLGFLSTALIARMTRSVMLETLQEDYIRTARAKGLTERVVIYRHALRNTMIPVVTVIGLSAAVLLGGAIVVETVAAVPGMGRLVIQAVVRRDYPLMQGLLITIAATYVLVNLAVDVIYVYLDPRVKHQ